MPPLPPIILPAVASALIRGGDLAATTGLSLGGKDNLMCLDRVRHDGDPRYRFLSYLRFDLSAIASAATPPSACSLRLVVSEFVWLQGEDHGLEIHRAPNSLSPEPDQLWTSETICWDNAPGRDEPGARLGGLVLPQPDHPEVLPGQKRIGSVITIPLDLAAIPRSNHLTLRLSPTKLDGVRAEWPRWEMLGFFGHDHAVPAPDGMILAPTLHFTA